MPTKRQRKQQAFPTSLYLLPRPLPAPQAHMDLQNLLCGLLTLQTACAGQ